MGGGRVLRACHSDLEAAQSRKLPGRLCPTPSRLALGGETPKHALRSGRWRYSNRDKGGRSLLPFSSTVAVHVYPSAWRSQDTTAVEGAQALLPFASTVSEPVTRRCGGRNRVDTSKQQPATCTTAQSSHAQRAQPHRHDDNTNQQATRQADRHDAPQADQ